MKKKYKVLNGLFACALTIGVIATPVQNAYALEATDDFTLTLIDKDKILVDLLTADSVVLPNGTVVTSDTTYTATDNKLYTFIGIKGEEKTQRSITTINVNTPGKQPIIVAPGQQVFLNMDSNDAHSGVTDSRIRTSETDTTWGAWGDWGAFNKKKIYKAPSIPSNKSSIKTIQAQYKDLAGNMSDEVSAQLVVDSTKPVSELDTSTIYTNKQDIMFPMTIKSQWVKPETVQLSESSIFKKEKIESAGVDARYSYKGFTETFDVPYTGTYKIQLWGAGGGIGGTSGYSNMSLKAGKGGYVSGKIVLNKGDKLEVNVGGRGKKYDTEYVPYTAGIIPGGWNGGGAGYNRGYESINGYSYNKFSGGGGGATDVRKGGSALGNRILVAGGGGGTNEYKDAGHAGGLSSVYSEDTNLQATQTSAGRGGSLGKGGDSIIPPNIYYSLGGGGGGGYYGGGSNQSYSGAGGSSYYNATSVFQGVTYSGAESMPASYTTNWEFPESSIGNIGNGYARISMDQVTTFLDDFTNYELKDYSNLFTENDPASSWQTYKYEVPFKLSAGEGQKTVYMKSTKTIAPLGTGQSQTFTSNTASRKVVYDKTAPTGKISINNGDDVVNSEEVELSINTSDVLSGVEEMKITEWSLFEDSTPPKEEKSEVIKKPSGSFKLPWTMAEGEKKMFIMTLKDKAGNTVTINSNVVEYVKLSISRIDLTNVVNPDKYKKDEPFKTITLPTTSQDLMAGGSFDFKVLYDIGTMDPAKTVVKGFYTVSVQKPVGQSNGETTWELSNLKVPFDTKVDGENAFIASYDIPKKTPSNTKISISVEIEAYNRDKPEKKHSFAYYPNTSVPNLIGTVQGELEEKIRFNGIN